MKTTSRRTLQVMLASSVLATAAAHAQTAAPASQPAPDTQKAAVTSAPQDWSKALKNPTSWFSWGADLRLRNETAFNATQSSVGANHEMSAARFRARLWDTIKPADFVELNSRLTWESRYYEEKYKTFKAGFYLDEALFDIMNVRFTNVCSQPVGLTVGRQEITDLGGGWLIMDGTPLDGSRTLFFDAARLVFGVPDIKTTFNVIYIDQGAETDRWLAPINQVAWRNNLIEQDERGVILYGSNTSIKNLKLDGFFIWKQDNQNVLATGNDGNLYAFGNHGEYTPTEHIKYTLDWAYELGNRQLGAKPEADINAAGVNTAFTYSFKDSLNNKLTAGYEYLSGDNPGTAGTSENFDVLWGRYPRFTEFMAYDNFAWEGTGRGSDYSNMHRPNVGWGITPMKDVDISVNYSAMFSATHQSQGIAGYGTGSFKGHLLQNVIRYTYSSHAKFHILNELFFPGDYYDTAHRNAGVFLRGEMFLTL